MRIHKYLRVKENRKYIPIMPPDLALLLTLISSNYPCLEHIVIVSSVFEPLKFYFVYTESGLTCFCLWSICHTGRYI